jgi:hypothetical protein
VAALLLLSLVPLSAAADEPAEQHDFTLAAGDRAFWSGPGSAMADCGTNCWSYRLHVTEPGYRLRVGIERPLLGDIWQVDRGR